MVNYTHGHATHGANSSTYNSWVRMLSRCTNPNDAKYSRYGGRGIKVCERWLNSFEAFLEDMGERPDDKSIDRKDNDGDYNKDNCKWSTNLDQSRNRSTTILDLNKAVDIAYTAITEPKSFRALALQFDMSTSTIHTICYRKHWPEAMDLALKRAAQDLKIEGVMK